MKDLTVSSYYCHSSSESLNDLFDHVLCVVLIDLLHLMFFCLQFKGK